VTSPAVDVSVLTPVLNEARDLDGVVADMLAQRFDGAAEFLFIDGGSEDGSLDILERWRERDPRVQILHNPARRTPHALNLGLRHARGEFVARMDAHCHYPPDYLAVGVARMRAGDAATVVGPQIAVGKTPGSRRVALALATPLGVGGARFRSQHPDEDEWEVDTGFTGVWRRDTLIEHGGWDEEWLNDQDSELAARLREEGGRIVCVRRMAANYIPRSTLSGLARQYARYGRYRVKTSRRHPDSLRRSQLLPPGLALTAVAAAVAPRPVARPARAGQAAYATALFATAAAAAAGGEDPRDVVALPAVFATMHLSYGAGFLLGCARDGVPVAALRKVVKSVVPSRSARSPDGGSSADGG
jgi:GT2 family glycosyltransferase